MVRTSVFGSELNIIEPRGCVAMHVCYKLHQQYALVEVIRLGNPHTGSCEPVQSIDFSTLPGFLLRLTPILRALFHGAGTATTLYFAPFGVINALAKTALVG